MCPGSKHRIAYQRFETFVANGALERPVWVVRQSMIVQVAFLHETFAALIASVFADSQMYSLVRH